MKSKYYSPSIEYVRIVDMRIMAAVSQPEDNDAESKHNPWGDEEEENSSHWSSDKLQTWDE